MVAGLTEPSVRFHTRSTLPPRVPSAAQTSSPLNLVFNMSTSPFAPQRPPSGPCRHVSGGKRYPVTSASPVRTLGCPSPLDGEHADLPQVSGTTDRQELNLRRTVELQESRAWSGVTQEEGEQWRPNPSPSCLWDALDRSVHTPVTLSGVGTSS